ncbi:MAG: hypothetical protein H6Q05_32 [Acidobacteria bacterium]|nr:hypothetical protein [Acidobacteriota bacterium]
MGKETVIDLAKRNDAREWQKPTEQKHKFQVKHHEGYVLEMEDLLFHFDSAVMMPNYEPAELEPDIPPYRISGLAVLRACYLHAQKHPSQKLLIAGHTDRSGPEIYNEKLSRLRAQNVSHALMGQKESWVETALAKHRVEDYQQILKWVDGSRGWNCDPGDIDNLEGPITRDAVYAFQVSYNRHFKASISEDGIVGKETWGAFFDIYMDELCALMETDQAGLKNCRSAIKFLKDGCKSVGCGKHFPISGERKNRSSGEFPEGSDEERDAKDKYRSKEDRRVEFLFFDPKHAPPLDCHPDSETCLPEECVINRSTIYRFKHITVEPVPHLIWLDLQTVDDFGFRVPQTDLTLAPECGKAVKITTDEDGYWGGRIRADGYIKVFLGDGKTAVYFAGDDRSSEELKPAVLDPRIASKAISDLLVPGSITDDQKKSRRTLVRRYGRIPAQGYKTSRAGNTDEDEGEPVGQMSQRGREAPEGEAPRMYRRSYGYIVADNLFIAAGFNKEGNVKLDDLVSVIGDWVKAYHPSALKRGYFLELILYNRLVVCPADGGKVLGQFTISDDYQINQRYGAYTPFECFGWVFRDMNTESTDFIVQKKDEAAAEPTEEPAQNESADGEPAQDKSAQTDLSSVRPDVTSSEKILPIDMILVEKDRDSYRKLLLGELAGKAALLYLVPMFGAGPWLARHGGTGLLENYPDTLSAGDREKLHRRNKTVIRTCRALYEAYIRKYVDDVKKTKSDQELYKMGPPDSHFLYPEPVGITASEWRELREAQATADEFLGWKAISNHLCELYGVHGDGDIWLRLEIEVDSGEALGKILDVKYKWNFETTAEGRFKKKSGQTTLSAKSPPLDIKGIKYKGGLSYVVNDEGFEEAKGQFAAGQYSLEYNITTGEVKAGVGPFFLRMNEEVKQLGFGAQFSTRDLYKKLRANQLANGVAPEMALNPDMIPAVKFAAGLQMQLLEEATVLAFLMGTRGFFERRPLSELMQADWASLDLDERYFLKELGWHAELADLPALRPALKHYPGDMRLWDLKRVLPYDCYPKSAQSAWKELTYAQKRAALNLLGSPWAGEANWLKLWRSFVPKAAKAKEASA